MRYFVTGATGFVGGHVTRQLLDAGHEVVALVRDLAKARSLVELGVTLAQGDITEKESLREPMAGVDGLFHIAGWYVIGAEDTSPAQRINVEGTRNVLEMMADLEIPRGVYTSSLAANSDTGGRVVDESYDFAGQHLNDYDRSKAEAHDIADGMIADGLPLVIVMPGVVYGPGDHSLMRDVFVRYLERDLPMVSKETGFCWGHVEDIARAHVLAMEKGTPGETYIIAGPCHTLVETLDVAEEITGFPAPPSGPPALFRVLAAVAGVAEKIFPLPATYRSETLRILGGATYLGDNAKARRELGYEPRPLREGLIEVLDHEMELLGMRGAADESR